MTIQPDVPSAIGNTPLIKLRHASELTGCTILGKAEFMNPGQSVKDRAALFIINEAIRRGDLKPGGVVVDGTAGNTGIGLAMVANALGMRTVIVIPETQTQEKKDALRALGADLVEVPAVPYRNPNNYVKVSGRMAERLGREEPNGALTRPLLVGSQKASGLGYKGMVPRTRIRGPVAGGKTCCGCAAPSSSRCRPCPTATPTIISTSAAASPTNCARTSQTA